MEGRKKIFAIPGSAGRHSANVSILKYIAERWSHDLDLEITDALMSLPHFNPEESIENTPESVLTFRDKIEKADGVIICTPEYIFSIPSILKNAIEWCVSTTVFSHKPVGLITASASGRKGHEELQLIMRTIEATFTDQTTLLIQGVKGKVDQQGKISHPQTLQDIGNFMDEFLNVLA